jgi:DNA polymerase-3 subunit delta
MDIASFEKQIAQGKILCSVFIFAGPEEFLKERMLARFTEKFVAKEDQSENIFRIECKNTSSLSEETIYSFSFNPSPRIFLLQNFESINSASRKKFVAALCKKGIPTNTFIIFLTTETRISQELARAFKTEAEKIDFWRPFENQLPGWVKKEAAELGGKISSEAADLLIELTGSNLGVLYQELKKLVISASKKTIDADMVKTNVSYLRQDSVFDFLNNFARKDTKKALRALETLIDQGEAPQKIWFMLCRQLREFRLLHKLRVDRPDLFKEVFEILQNYALISNKTDFKANQSKKNLLAKIQQLAANMPEHIVKSLSLTNPAKLKNLYLATSFNISELNKALPMLVETDLKLKSGVPDAKACLQAFTCNFIN